MRSFTNLDGELIELSDEHLDVAIKLKEELQKASPSRRTSWAQHKRMMVAEGFEDGENSEAYRCCIKAEQKSRGTLPEVEKHAEFVSDNKLQSLKDEIGNIRENKMEAQQEFLKLNRLKRELSKDIVLLEGIERALTDKDLSSVAIKIPFFDSSKQEKRMVVCLSDIHYGSFVDIDGHYYDTTRARILMETYLSKVLALAEANNVSKVHIVGIGDYFEHDSMRIQNTYNAERTFTEQIVDFSEIIIEFLKTLSMHVDIEYSAIGGNHDRVAGNKNDSIFGEHMVTVSNRIVETFIKYSGNERIKYVNAKPYSYTLELFGRNFLFVHGDTTPIKKQSVLAEQSTLHGKNFDAIIAGHYHRHSVLEVGDDKYVAVFGGMKGSDEYSLYAIGASSSRSQGVIIVSANGDYEIKQVKL